jgi:hypothetical protein
MKSQLGCISAARPVCEAAAPVLVPVGMLGIGPDKVEISNRELAVSDVETVDVLSGPEVTGEEVTSEEEDTDDGRTGGMGVGVGDALDDEGGGIGDALDDDELSSTSAKTKSPLNWITGSWLPLMKGSSTYISR